MKTLCNTNLNGTKKVHFVPVYIKCFIYNVDCSKVYNGQTYVSKGSFCN